MINFSEEEKEYLTKKGLDYNVDDIAGLVTLKKFCRIEIKTYHTDVTSDNESTSDSNKVFKILSSIINRINKELITLRNSVTGNIENEFVRFNRIDGTSFELKVKDKIEIMKGEILYTYYFKEPDINQGNVRTLFTELSPNILLEIMSEQDSLSYFENVFLSSKRTENIFKNVVPGNESNQEEGYNRFIGNGYAGYMGEIHNASRLCGLDIPSQNYIVVGKQIGADRQMLQEIYIIEQDKAKGKYEIDVNGWLNEEYE